MPGEVKDDTTQVVKVEVDGTSEGKADEKVSTEDLEVKKVETDDVDLDNVEKKDIEGQVAGAEDRIQGILDKFNVDSLEELEEKWETLSEKDKKLGEHDVEKLIEDAEYLAKVKEFWKEQEEAKTQEGETADETIDRLAKEKKEVEQKLLDRDKKEADTKDHRDKAVRADQMIKSFNSTVMAEIEGSKDLPKEYKPFLKEYLGVDNPANEINIGLKPEIRSMAKEGIKKFMDIEQVIIKRYLDGKIKTPVITSSDTAPVGTEVKPKNLKEARKQLYAIFGIKR